MKRQRGYWGAVILLLLVMIGTLAGCKSSANKEHKSDNGIITKDAGEVRKDLTSLELVDQLGNGINLGNTMEAYGRTQFGANQEVSKYETFWGQPVTTQEMISGMKAAGFTTLRIPIAWTNAIAFESGDYTIGTAYLDRIEEIMNYALNEDMYVIINDHWDGSWWGKFGSASQQTREEAMKMYVSMWTQIANRYKEYSDHLIFEGANEEVGSRLNDIDLCPDGNTLSEDECYETANTIIQTFVDTVRSTGGNNKNRFLLIPGYNTDIDKTCDSRFKMPADTAKDKLLISVHFYTPWGYCGNSSLTYWGTLRNVKEQNDLLAKMTQYTEQGYGVIIGEYAVAFRENGSVKDNLDGFLSNFLNNCDFYGYCPLLWDCNGLYSKASNTLIDTAAAKVYQEHSLENQAQLTKEAIQEQAKKAMDDVLATAVDAKEQNAELNADTAMAWIMFNSNDWGLMYSVGDVYDPLAKSDGLIATDAEITGEGTYTVSLDFTGTSAGYAVGTAFSALAISNGEVLYPGYVITPTKILINGEVYECTQNGYTTSDDMVCTRFNLYNSWVKKVPAEARTKDGDLTNASPTLLDNDKLAQIKTISITFEYGPMVK